MDEDKQAEEGIRAIQTKQNSHLWRPEFQTVEHTWTCSRSAITTVLMNKYATSVSVFLNTQIEKKTIFKFSHW